MRSLKAVLAGAVLLLMGLPSSAQQTVPLAPRVEPRLVQPDTRAPQIPARPGTPVLDATDLNAFLDGFIPFALASGDIAGGVIVVVKDGQILSQRGFGYADVASRKPVDPARTLFRPGSVSKLFTWTAVMQQVEQGKIDLDADVNRYLDFKIPPRDGQPVTMRQLMKHAAGFEEQVKSIITFDPEQARSMEALLKAWVPERIFPAGSTGAYSNYSTALAGYIVQRVSGVPFDDYIERNVFAPIGMRNSTFRQPLPARLRPMMATGYQVASGEPKGFEFIGPAAAGSLSATGEDMGRFMIAHLQRGRGLLRPETADLMHRGATTRDIPSLPGMELGFYETDINGREAIAHGGDTVAFHSMLHLFPQEGVGIYASFNSTGKNGAVSGLRSALYERFADRYFPAPADTRRVDPETARQHAQMLAGTWSNSRRSESSFLNATQLMSQVHVTVAPDGSPIVPLAQGLNGQPRKWVEVEPFLWIDPASHERLGAKVVNGKIVRFSLSGFSPFMVFDRTPWYKSSALLMPLLYASLAALLLTALLWPVSAVVRRRYGAKLALEGRPLLVYRATKVTSLLVVGVLVGWVVLISAMFADLSNLGPAMDGPIRLLQILSVIVFLGAVAIMAWNLWTVWKGGGRRWPAKVWSIVLLLAVLVVLWVALAFNLIGFSANY